MIDITSYQIFTSADQIPNHWDSLSDTNSLLSIPYLHFLERASPVNFTNYFIGLYAQSDLKGILIIQKVDLQKVEHFGQRDHFFKKILRTFLFKNFSGQLLIVGNNLISGSQSFNFHSKVNLKSVLNVLEKLIQENFHKNIHLTILKDFDASFPLLKELNQTTTYFGFTAQPCMVFSIPADWTSFDHYLIQLSKKYRDQYKRSRKKGEGLVKRVLTFNEIVQYESVLHELYLHVANHSPFNTFFLPENHFVELKKYLGDQFRVYAYFLDDNLVGFNSIIQNGDTLETYFLGYDEVIQKEYMLYLNMLYDMLEYGINEHFKSINFGRTAMEIKSSIGAQVVWLNSYMKHSNPLINRYLAKFYHLLEPKVEWKERHPFKKLL